MNFQASVANRAWCVTCRQDWRQYRQALEHPLEAQQHVLGEILHSMQGSAVLPGKFEDLEPRNWSAFEPLLKRSAKGETGLFGRSAIRRFVPTSGSDSGSKWIPYNAMLERQFQRGIRAWVYEMFRCRPPLARGPAYWSISPALPAQSTPGGIPIGFDEDSAYLGGLGRKIVDRAMAVPASIRSVRANDFQRSTLLLLLAQSELRLISVWSPTFLISLMNYYQDHRDELHSELAAGTRVLGRVLQRQVHGNPWPKLGMISCWTDGQASPWLEDLRQQFPGVAIQGKGLIATEAFVSLPFGSQRPLAVTSHFLEFEFDDGRLCPVGDLKEGDEAVVVVTTGGGLLRYRLGDRIAVTGFEGNTPAIRFLGRQGRVSDRYGEKLSEAFVSKVLSQLGLSGFSLLAPDEKGYTLYTESAANADHLERALQQNIHYHWAVSNGQMRNARVCTVQGNALQKYLARCERRGQKLGDIKPASLDLDSGWRRWFYPDGCERS